jgi:hypothetical protein
MARFTHPLSLSAADFQNAMPQPVSWTPEVTSTNGTFAQSSNPAIGNYLRYGRMIVANLFVPFTNVTDFGTGQYQVTLPFAANFHTDVYAGSIHNTNANSHYSLKGHLNDDSNIMTLWYISGASKDEPFVRNAPIQLATDDLFHMSFIYETDE